MKNPFPGMNPYLEEHWRTQCFERGRYWMLDYRRDLRPPLTSDDASWADQLLRKSDLR